MTMTKAQLEAWLEGWREAEAFSREGAPPVNECTGLELAMELSEVARKLAPPTTILVDREVWLAGPWTRLRLHLGHG